MRLLLSKLRKIIVKVHEFYSIKAITVFHEKIENPVTVESNYTVVPEGKGSVLPRLNLVENGIAEEAWVRSSYEELASL